MTTTNHLDGLGLFPGDGDREISTSKARGYNATIERQIGTLPIDYTYRVNELLAVSDAGDVDSVLGPVTAQEVTALSGADRPLCRFKPFIGAGINTGDVVLTDSLHGGGGLVLMGNAAPATVTIALAVDPLVGCSSPFYCTILRLVGSAEVQVIFAGLSNRNPPWF